MNIKTEKDITGAAAKALREQAGETQTAFWRSVGLTQSGGSRYEGGQTIPKPVRMLIFIRYVAGLKMDLSSPEGAEQIVRLANLQASELAPQKEKIGEKLNTAMKSIKHARNTLSEISGEDSGKGGAQ